MELATSSGTGPASPGTTGSGTPPVSVAGSLERLRYLEPSKELRAAWQYNNLMYLAAGMVDERISGKPWRN